jgi:hypothetical protein
MLAHLRSALRYPWRRPRDTGLAVAALALGTGATLTLAALVNAAFVTPLPYPTADRIVRLSERQAEIPDRRVSYPNFLDWQARNDSFELMAAVRETTPVLRPEQGARVLDARQVTANYFRVLGVAPFIGRDFTAAEDRIGAPRVAIVSAALWSADFGAAPNIVGRQLSLGDGDYTIIGVADRFSQLPGTPEVWTLTGQLAAPDSAWFGRSNRIAGYVLARLRADRGIEEARADMRRVGDALAAEFPIHNAGHTIDIVTLQQSLVGNVRLPLLLAFGAVGVLLLIVCTNVANLLLVAAIRREHEFALRAALGADGGRGRRLTDRIRCGVVRVREYRRRQRPGLALRRVGRAARLAWRRANGRSLRRAALAECVDRRASIDGGRPTRLRGAAGEQPASDRTVEFRFRRRRSLDLQTVGRSRVCQPRATNAASRAGRKRPRGAAGRGVGSAAERAAGRRADVANGYRAGRRRRERPRRPGS